MASLAAKAPPGLPVVACLLIGFGCAVVGHLAGGDPCPDGGNGTAACAAPADGGDGSSLLMRRAASVAHGRREVRGGQGGLRPEEVFAEMQRIVAEAKEAPPLRADTPPFLGDFEGGSTTPTSPWKSPGIFFEGCPAMSKADSKFHNVWEQSYGTSKNNGGRRQSNSDGSSPGSGLVWLPAALTQSRRTAAAAPAAAGGDDGAVPQECDVETPCKGCSGVQCTGCREDAKVQCCVDSLCRGCSGESCVRCQAEGLKSCCVGAHPLAQKCEEPKKEPRRKGAPTTFSTSRSVPASSPAPEYFTGITVHVYEPWQWKTGWHVELYDTDKNHAFRFDAMTDRKKIARSAEIDGVWSPEETSGRWPWTDPYPDPTVLYFGINETAFEVTIDGIRHPEFDFVRLSTLPVEFCRPQEKLIESGATVTYHWVDSAGPNASSNRQVPECAGGTLIGRFDGQGGYQQFCCAAGVECSGCARLADLKCVECATGYVMQEVPISKEHQCFMCDDLPTYTDKYGRTCSDYEELGLCANGTWPEESGDEPYQGMRPSQACCACGGGILEATPYKFPLSEQVLYQGQEVVSWPQPPPSMKLDVDEGCGLAVLGLSFTPPGGVQGKASDEGQTSCEVMASQDDKRGIASVAQLDVQVDVFSYGFAMVDFKHKGFLATEPEQSKYEVLTLAQLRDFTMICVPDVDWLEIDKASGMLIYYRSEDLTAPPDNTQTQCRVTALEGSGSDERKVDHEFVAAITRVWEGGSYERSEIQATVGVIIRPSELKELLPAGYSFWERKGQELQVEVVQDQAGNEYALPAVTPPDILDVACRAVDPYPAAAGISMVQRSQPLAKFGRFEFMGFATMPEARSTCGAGRRLVMPKNEGEWHELTQAMGAAFENGTLNDTWPFSMTWLGGVWSNDTQQWIWLDGSQVDLDSNKYWGTWARDQPNGDPQESQPYLSYCMRGECSRLQSRELGVYDEGAKTTKTYAVFCEDEPLDQWPDLRPGKRLAWSRQTGDVRLDGTLAFNLDPISGTISGVPELDLSMKTGRGKLNVFCEIALGGEDYEEGTALKVLEVTVKIQDDQCWIPRPTQQDDVARLWESLGPLPEEACIRECRRRADCGMVSHEEGECAVQTSSASSANATVEAKRASTEIVRLLACGEEISCLHLAAPQGSFVAGKYCPEQSPTEEPLEYQIYARAGKDAQEEFVMSLAQDGGLGSCGNNTWAVMHANATDYRDSETGVAELHGFTAGCLTRGTDLIDEIFDLGIARVPLEIDQRELDDARLSDPSHVPASPVDATLSLKPADCGPPKVSTPDGDAGDLLMTYGVLGEPDHYTLHVCECFGEEYSMEEPVTAESNSDVPRMDDAASEFNAFNAISQLIFSGPYACEFDAVIDQSTDVDMEACETGCKTKAGCAFFIFNQESPGMCMHLSACSHIGHVGFQTENELYGIIRQPVCRIADPDACWQATKRRSMLSLERAEDEVCMFQDQLENCDTLQLALGLIEGQCSRCTYVDATASSMVKSRKKVPLPSTFAAGSQVEIGCLETGRLFASMSAEWGDKVVGPFNSTVFTCVSGQWRGEAQGHDQFVTLDNLTCHACVQVGNGEMQEQVKGDVQEVDFLSYRVMQSTSAGKSNKGCNHAGKQTASALVSTVDSSTPQQLQVTEMLGLTLGSGGSEKWYFNEQYGQLRVVSGNQEYCLTGPEDSSEDDDISVATCGQGSYQQSWNVDASSRIFYVVEGLRRCLVVKESSSAVGLRDCDDLSTLGRTGSWYFDGGDCMWAMDAVDVAKQTYSYSVEPVQEAEAPGVRPLPLRLLEYRPTKMEGTQTKSYAALRSGCASGEDCFENLGTCRARFDVGVAEPIESLTAKTLSDDTWLQFKIEDCDIKSNEVIRSIRMYAPDGWVDGYEGNSSHPVFDFKIWSTMPDGDGALEYELTCYVNYDGPDAHKCFRRSIAVPWPFPKGFESTQSFEFEFFIGDDAITVNLDGNAMKDYTEPRIREADTIVTGLSATNLTGDPKPTYAEWGPPIARCLEDKPDGVKNSYRISRYFQIEAQRDDGLANDAGPLLSCVPGRNVPLTGGPDPALTWTTCGQDVVLSSRSIGSVHAKYQNRSLREQADLVLTRQCAVVGNGELDDSVSADAAQQGLKTKVFMSTLRDQVFRSELGARPTGLPFNVHTQDEADANQLGYYTLVNSGAFVWGIKCPPGTAVVATESVPAKCEWVDAGVDRVQTNDLAGAVSCANGHAIAAWYDLPGQVLYGSQIETTGGPPAQFAQGLSVVCRKVPGLTMLCSPPKGAFCDEGQLITGFDFEGANDALRFKCCALKRPVSMKFTMYERVQRRRATFEGYYCPIRVDSTGRPEYQHTRLRSLGDPVPKSFSDGRSASDETILFWNRFKGEWTLSDATTRATLLLQSPMNASQSVDAVLPGDALTPTGVDAPKDAPLSAAEITFMDASHLGDMQPKNELVPDKQPVYPTLDPIMKTEPSYKKYCDPKYLADPAGSLAQLGDDAPGVDDGTPCSHTFHAVIAEDDAKPPLSPMVGITEDIMWNCASREKMRDVRVMENQQKDFQMKAEGAQTVANHDMISMYVELAATAAGAFPWGNFATFMGIGARKGSEMAKKSVLKALVSKLKAFIPLKKAKRKHKKAQDTMNNFKGNPRLKPMDNFEKMKYDIAKDVFNGKKQTSNEAWKNWKGNYEFQDMSRKGQAVSLSVGAVPGALSVVNPARNVHRQEERTGSGLGQGEGSIPKALREAQAAAVEEAADTLTKLLVPPLKDPDFYGFSQANNAESLAAAKDADCMPLQYGLSRLMCDMFCTQNAVRQGNEAILDTIVNSQKTLQSNLDALMKYYTQSILWYHETSTLQQQAMVASERKSSTLVSPQLLEVQEMLKQLQSLPRMLEDSAREVITTDAETDRLRAAAAWHQQAAPDLVRGLQAALDNVTAETLAFRLSRARALTGAFGAKLKEQLASPVAAATASRRAGNELKDAATYSRDNLELLRGKYGAHRGRITAMAAKKAKRRTMVRSGAEADASLDSGAGIVWDSLADSLVQAHMKHHFYLEMRMRALDMAEAAMEQGHNFLGCGADAADLQQAWQKAIRADEHADEALLQAWAATVAAQERATMATDSEQLPRRVATAIHLSASAGDDGDDDDDGRAALCTDLGAAAHRAHGEAVRRVDGALWLLTEQVLALTELGAFQKQELAAKRLRHVGQLDLGAVAASIRAAAEASTDPARPEGLALVARALDAMGPKWCPAPSGCHGMHVATNSSSPSGAWVASKPGDILLGSRPQDVVSHCATAVAGDGTDGAGGAASAADLGRTARAALVSEHTEEERAGAEAGLGLSAQELREIVDSTRSWPAWAAREALDAVLAGPDHAAAAVRPLCAGECAGQLKVQLQPQESMVARFWQAIAQDTA